MLFLILLSLLAFHLIYLTLRLGIGPTPSSKKVRHALLSIAPTPLKGSIADLGSGWGHLLIDLAKRYPHCQIIGYELSPLPFLYSLCWIRLSSLPNITLHYRNFFSQELQEHALLVSYLYPGAMAKLVLAPDQYLLSHTFSLPGKSPIKRSVATDCYNTPCFLYQNIELTLT